MDLQSGVLAGRALYLRWQACSAFLLGPGVHPAVPRSFAGQPRTHGAGARQARNRAGASRGDLRDEDIQDAAEGIDTVLQRCIDVDHLETGALTEQRETEDVADLFARLADGSRTAGTDSGNQAVLNPMEVANLSELALAPQDGVDAERLLAMLRELRHNSSARSATSDIA